MPVYTTVRITADTDKKIIKLAGKLSKKMIGDLKKGDVIEIAVNSLLKETK